MLSRDNVNYPIRYSRGTGYSALNDMGQGTSQIAQTSDLKRARQGRDSSCHLRIMQMFVGSPVLDNEEDTCRRLAKRLRKEKVIPTCCLSVN